MPNIKDSWMSYKVAWFRRLFNSTAKWKYLLNELLGEVDNRYNVDNLILQGDRDWEFIGKKIKSVFWSECFLVVKPFLRELLWQYPEKIVSCILWGSNYFMKNNKPIDAKSFPTLANKITYPAELITYNEGGSKFKDYAEIVKSYGNVDQNEFISLKVIIIQSFQKIKS